MLYKNKPQRNFLWETSLAYIFVQASREKLAKSNFMVTRLIVPITIFILQKIKSGYFYHLVTEGKQS